MDTESNDLECGPRLTARQLPVRPRISYINPPRNAQLPSDPPPAGSVPTSQPAAGSLDSPGEEDPTVQSLIFPEFGGWDLSSRRCSFFSGPSVE